MVWCQGNSGFIERTGYISSASILQNNLKGIGFNSYLKVKQNSALNSSGPGLFYPPPVWRQKKMASSFLMGVTGLPIRCRNFVNCIYQECLHFFLGVAVWWIQNLEYVLMIL